jgi:hypothetical protein
VNASLSLEATRPLNAEFQLMMMVLADGKSFMLIPILSSVHLVD